MSFSSLPDVLYACCANCQAVQLVKVNRVFSDEDVRVLKEGQKEAVQDVCHRVGQADSCFSTLLLQASISRSSIRSEHFRSNSGCYVGYGLGSEE